MKFSNLLDTTVNLLNEAYDSHRDEINLHVGIASVNHTGTLEQFENYLAWDIILKYNIDDKIISMIDPTDKYSDTYLRDMNDLLEVAIRKSKIVY